MPMHRKCIMMFLVGVLAALVAVYIRHLLACRRRAVAGTPAGSCSDCPRKQQAAATTMQQAMVYRQEENVLMAPTTPETPAAMALPLAIGETSASEAIQAAAVAMPDGCAPLDPSTFDPASMVTAMTGPSSPVAVTEVETSLRAYKDVSGCMSNITGQGLQDIFDATTGSTPADDE